MAVLYRTYTIKELSVQGNSIFFGICKLPHLMFQPTSGARLNMLILTTCIQSTRDGLLASDLKFISLWHCNKEGARDEWYDDFATRAQTEYDLLGHIVDWLRIICTRISVQYVVFEKEDPWITAYKLEKDRLKKEAARIAKEKLEEQRRADAIIPPSIFDIPWAKSRSS
ncbi:hypothetical protein N7520_007554 [Penicillium odoratum]|uniref:uncharacterized protein n=1 Tax=Penicillium odoratum TaxID=1167516 RepID=UPI0025480B82|nr:uncharacterized protein N7520_007554 [Penicillium odoratum]KAJ5760398.1 hypothetical protein N7520_007554 [Penicillium odoratum]